MTSQGKSSAKPLIGGTMGVVAGSVGLVVGVIIMGLDDDAGKIYGIALFVLGILAIVGSGFAVSRKHFILAVAGAIIAAFLFFPLGIPALVLISMSYDEFKTPQSQKPLINIVLDERSTVHQSNEYICPQCGNRVFEDWKICAYCEEPLIETVGYCCSECGFDIEDGWKVCPQCSTPLDELA